MQALNEVVLTYFAAEKSEDNKGMFMTDTDKKEEGDKTGGVIPYKNPSALTSYYMGLFSILPLVDSFLG